MSTSESLLLSLKHLEIIYQNISLNRKNLRSIFLYISLLFFLSCNLYASGGYDHGTSAGKGHWDISLTWNPFNYFEHGQSYIVFGYGLTNKFDIHGYYSNSHRQTDNYYGGVSYQFYESKNLDLSTAIGIRKYTNSTETHFFFPQLLYTLRLSEKFNIGGSFVNIRNRYLDIGMGIASDVFILIKIYENKKYKWAITIGGFKPVFWESKNSLWYPTYSIDLKKK